MFSLKKRKNTSFHKSIRNTFFIYALVPITIILILWCSVIFGYSYLVVKKTNQSANAEILNILSEQYMEYKNILTDPLIHEKLATSMNKKNILDINKMFYDFNNSQEIKSIFYLFDSEGNLISSNSWEDRDNLTLKTFISQETLAFIEEMPHGNIYEKTILRSNDSMRKTVYLMIAPLKSVDENRGFLAFELLEKDFLEIAKQNDVNYTIITDKYNNNIATNDIKILGKLSKFNRKEDQSKITINNNKFYLTQGIKNGSSFKVYTLTYFIIQDHVTWFGIIFILLTIILITIFLYHIGGNVADNNTESLSNLVVAVEKMSKGEFSYNVDFANNKTDEFKYLSDEYNKLYDEITKLLLANKELVETSKTSEIMQLQAQFNPHFIFNVLETLKYQIYLNKDHAAEIINLLSKLLRYSISNDSDTVELGYDISYIESYLALQKIRFNERLAYTIYIPDDLKKIQIPRLVIQPIVENCINHGYKQKESLEINIIGTIEGENVEIRVTDNGDGINEEKLKELEIQLSQNKEKSNSVGLYNSHRRLQLIYGEEYGIKISSVQKVGTEVILILSK